MALIMFHDTASKHLHKEEGVVPRRKRSKTPNEVKAIENVNKDPQCFIGISLKIKEDPPHINCKTMFMSNTMALK